MFSSGLNIVTFFVRLGKIDVFHGGFLAPSPILPHGEGRLYSLVARWLRWLS
jgi:hypothetical protein